MDLVVKSHRQTKDKAFFKIDFEPEFTEELLKNADTYKKAENFRKTYIRNSISSGHNILSTIHADKAESIPNRLYSLLESNIDLEQFLRSIHRYVQLGVHVKGYYSKERQKFHREIAEVTEFYVDEDNNPKSNIIYKKTPDGKVILRNPTKYLLGYLESQGLIMQPDILVKEQFKSPDDKDEYKVDNSDTLQKPIQTNQYVAPRQIQPQQQANIMQPRQVNAEKINNINNNQMNNNMWQQQPKYNNFQQQQINQRNMYVNQMPQSTNQ